MLCPEGDADALESSIEGEFTVIEDQWPLNGDTQLLIALCELPVVYAGRTVLPPVDASVLVEIFGVCGAAMLFEVRGRGDSELPQRAAESNRDYFIFQQFSQADA